MTDKIGEEPSFDRKIVSRFASATAPVGCGSSIADGNIDIARFTNESIAAGLPSFATGQALDVTYVQINAGPDGGGPLRALIDKSGSGRAFGSACLVADRPGAFVPVPMAANIDEQGRGNAAHSVAIAVPSQLTCAGVGGSCLFAVINPRGFGGCFIARPTKASQQRARARQTASLRMIRRTRRSLPRRSFAVQQ